MMAATRSGRGDIPAAETVWPRNSMELFPNSHFSALAVRLAARRRPNVSTRSQWWFSSPLLNTKMSSR